MSLGSRSWEPSDDLGNRLGDPPSLSMPDDWTLSTPWRRVNELEADDVEPWEAPDDRELATAYRTLCKHPSPTGIVRGPRARKALAQAVDSLDQDSATRVLYRLQDRGYVHLQSESPPSDYLAVHVRPFSKRSRSGGVASAD